MSCSPVRRRAEQHATDLCQQRMAGSSASLGLKPGNNKIEALQLEINVPYVAIA